MGWARIWRPHVDRYRALEPLGRHGGGRPAVGPLLGEVPRTAHVKDAGPRSSRQRPRSGSWPQLVCRQRMSKMSSLDPRQQQLRLDVGDPTEAQLAVDDVGSVREVGPKAAEGVAKTRRLRLSRGDAAAARLFARSMSVPAAVTLTSWVCLSSQSRGSSTENACLPSPIPASFRSGRNWSADSVVTRRPST